MIRAASLGLALALLAQAKPILAQDTDTRCHAPDDPAIRGWDGVWIAEGMRSDISGRSSADNPGQPLQPPLLTMPGAVWTDAGWAAVESLIRDLVRGVSIGRGWGFPMMMNSPAPLKFVVTPAETVITSQYREIRYIPTDGQPLPDEGDLWPTIWGTSAGCWEGDTLTVVTRDVLPDREQAGLSPPLSAEAEITERLRLVAPGRIEGTITIHDPENLEQPYTLALAYVRHPFITRLVHEGDVLSNDRLIEVDGQPSIAPPREAATSRPVPEFPPEVRLTAEERSRYLGRYAFEGAPLTLLVEEQRGRLMLRVVPAEPGFLPIYAEGAHRFHSRALGNWIEFSMGENGRAVQVTGIDPQGAPFVARREP